jgi:Zn-finger protein
MSSLWAFVIGLTLASGPAQGDRTASDEPGTSQDPYSDNACVQCHRSIAGRSAEIVDLEWANSVHAENGVTCDGCHGGDADAKREEYPTEEAFKEAAHLARNPEFLLLHGDERGFVSRSRGRSISYFCGRCHTEIMEKHLGSPHGNFGDPSCLFCHGQGSHLIKNASTDIIDTRPRTEAGRCSPCHQASTMKAVAEIKQILDNAADLIDSSAEKFIKLEELGYRNLALGELHHHTAETHSRLRRVFHSFNMRDINDLAHSIEVAAKQTDYAYELVQSLRQARRTQTLAGLGAVLFLLLFAGVLLFYKHAFCEHYDRSAAVPDKKPPSPGASA